MPIAFDKASVRSVDANGFLHVEATPISKATVNPYYGREIPDYQKLGLEADKVYHMLRDPKELAAAASTFNNLPLLDKHIPLDKFNLEDPEVKKHLVGSTGTDAEFEAPYLVNSLVIHTAGGIKAVESKTMRELSCAYRYIAVMTPGIYEGQRYDGVMTEISGNHVSLVEEGRAGHDVKVMDARHRRGVDYRKISAAMGNDGGDQIRAALAAETRPGPAAGSVTERRARMKHS